MVESRQLTKSQRWWGVANAVAALFFGAVCVTAFLVDRPALNIAWGATAAIGAGLAAMDFLVWREAPPLWLRIAEVVAGLLFVALTVARIL